jgi:hypothetical protein
MISYNESILVHSNPSEIQGELGLHLLVMWGRHLLNKNNYHAPEVHEIIFLFKMCT